MQNLKLGMSVGDYRMNCCRSLRTTNLHELRSIFFFVETTADCSGLFDFVHVFGASELVQLTVAWCAQCCLVVMNFLSNLVEKRVTLGVFFPFNLCVRKRDKSGQIFISHLPCTNMSLQRKWRLLSQYCIQARILSSTKKQSSFFFPHSRVVQVLSSAWRSQRISFCLHDERRRSSKTSRGSFEGSVPSSPLRHSSEGRVSHRITFTARAPRIAAILFHFHSHLPKSTTLPPIFLVDCGGPHVQLAAIAKSAYGVASTGRVERKAVP